MLARLTWVICFATLLWSCAGRQPGASGPSLAPPMTLSDFYGFCSSAPTPDGCYSDPICDRYRRDLANAPRDLAACLAMCQGVQDALYVDNLTNGCESVLDQAQDLCTQFCRRHDRS